jgi:hypothetical protein
MMSPENYYVPALGRICVALLAILAPCARAAQAAETTQLDCGVNALFVLCQLEGRSVTLDRVESALPPPQRAGHSMAELVAAGRRLGLSLEGVQRARGGKPLDRPAILFSKLPGGGHFAVLRPVGTTGTMVQVIDPPHAPWIADYDRLALGAAWTGMILIRRDPWLVRNTAPLIMAAAGCVLLLVGLGRRSLCPLRHGGRKGTDVPLEHGVKRGLA